MRPRLPSRPFPRSTTPASSEAGETLVEVMVAMVVLGISMVAIVGALLVTTRIGSYNQKTSEADLVLRDYAEMLKGRGTTTIGSTTYNATYLPCDTLGTTGSYPAFTPPDPHQDYTATITSISFLNGYTGTTPVWKAQSQGCPAGGDQGLQKLTLKVSAPNGGGNGASETTSIVKRNTADDS